MMEEERRSLNNGHRTGLQRRGRAFLYDAPLRQDFLEAAENCAPEKLG